MGKSCTNKCNQIGESNNEKYKNKCSQNRSNRWFNKKQTILKKRYIQKWAQTVFKNIFKKCMYTFPSSNCNRKCPQTAHPNARTNDQHNFPKTEIINPTIKVHAKCTQNPYNLMILRPQQAKAKFDPLQTPFSAWCMVHIFSTRCWQKRKRVDIQHYLKTPNPTRNQT